MQYALCLISVWQFYKLQLRIFNFSTSFKLLIPIPSKRKCLRFGDEREWMISNALRRTSSRSLWMKNVFIQILVSLSDYWRNMRIYFYLLGVVYCVKLVEHVHDVSSVVLVFRLCSCHIHVDLSCCTTSSSWIRILR